MADLSVTFGSYTFTNVTFFFPMARGVNPLVPVWRANGVFDPSGSEPAPIGEGEVELRFYFRVDDPDDVQALIDAVEALRWQGKQTLTWQPQGSAGTRAVQARVLDVSIPFDAENNLQFVEGKVMFQISSPFWIEASDVVVTQAISGLATTFTLSYADGTFIAIPSEIEITTAAGQTCSAPIIKRLNEAGGSVIWDQLSYTGSITGAGQAITIDPQAKSILVNGSTGLSAFSWSSKDWMRLNPGDNHFRIEMGDAGNAATLTITYRKTYIT